MYLTKEEIGKRADAHAAAAIKTFDAHKKAAEEGDAITSSSTMPVVVMHSSMATMYRMWFNSMEG